MKIDTYEALAELPIGAVIRDAWGFVAIKRDPKPAIGNGEWHITGVDRDADCYLIYHTGSAIHLPVEVLWSR